MSAVRKARLSDVPEILRIERESAEAPHWPEQVYRDAIGEGSARNVRRCVLIAQGAGGLAGFAVASLMLNSEAAEDEGEAVAELESIAVRQSSRRRGVGRLLCQEILAWAWGEGAKLLELEVRSASEGAIALYQQAGLQEVGRRKRYYRAPEDDAILMRIAAPELRASLRQRCRDDGDL